MIYFSPEFLAVLKVQFDSVSPRTWHKISHPWCAACLIEGANPVSSEEEE